MKLLKPLFYLLSIGLFLYGCASNPVKKAATEKEEPVVIANEALEYEIIIIDPGFTYYLNAIAQPINYYSQTYMENRNRIYVATWNYRAKNPLTFDPNIYENVIDYDSSINYGLEVNYKLFSYFKFAEQKYKMRLN